MSIVKHGFVSGGYSYDIYHVDGGKTYYAEPVPGQPAVAAQDWRCVKAVENWEAEGGPMNVLRKKDETRARIVCLRFHYEGRDYVIKTAPDGVGHAGGHTAHEIVGGAMVGPVLGKAIVNEWLES